MKVIIVTVISLIILFGCGTLTQHEKPFLIISKEPCDTVCLYNYQTSNGKWALFKDSCGKYNIGDTIK